MNWFNSKFVTSFIHVDESNGSAICEVMWPATAETIFKGHYWTGGHLRSRSSINRPHAIRPQWSAMLVCTVPQHVRG